MLNLSNNGLASGKFLASVSSHENTMVIRGVNDVAGRIECKCQRSWYGCVKEQGNNGIG